MKLTDQQRSELKVLADRFTSGYNVTVEAKRAEMFCAAIPALLADLEEAILQEDEMSANAGYLSEERQNLLAENADLRQQLVEAERKIALCIKSREDEIAEREAELAVTRQQLAEAQARLAHVNGCFEAASDEGLFERIAEVGHTYGDGSLADLVQRRLLHAPKTDPHSALQSAIEQAVAPYKQDADIYRYLTSINSAAWESDLIDEYNASRASQEKSND